MAPSPSYKGPVVKLAPNELAALQQYAGGDGHESFWGRCMAFFGNRGGLSSGQYDALLEQMDEDGLTQQADQSTSDNSDDPTKVSQPTYADY